jgi:chromosome segregation ATPase
MQPLLAHELLDWKHRFEAWKADMDAWSEERKKYEARIAALEKDINDLRACHNLVAKDVFDIARLVSDISQ